MEKNDLFKNRLIDLSRMAYEKNIVLFTGFLSLDELHILNTTTFKDLGVTLETFGGFESSERQMAAFVPDTLSYEWSYPIICLRIVPQSIKYSEVLTHRDYLGALLNLGIKREKIGDILVEEKETFVFCNTMIADFIKSELCRIKHTLVNIEICESYVSTYKQKVQVITGTVASIRLDSIISLAFSTSRNSMIPFIEGGKVFVNGKMVVSNGYQLKENDIISVRGKGKFKYLTSNSKTKKGRLVVQLEKYI